MSRECFIVDAFAGERFSGNAAAVVLAADGLSDSQMQRIAGEFNLSETTFVMSPKSSGSEGANERNVAFRWFTPTTEVDMCGHATIAGMHALFETGILAVSGSQELRPLRIHTRSGVLHGHVEQMSDLQSRIYYWLELLPPVLTPIAEVSTIVAALRIQGDDLDSDHPAVRTQDQDAIILVRDFSTLTAIIPDYSKLTTALKGKGLRGLCVSTVRTLTSAVNVQSRFFVPTCGINEDPVTGSVHGPLAMFLVERGIVPTHDGVAGMTCTQGIPGGRTGLLHALVQNESSSTRSVRIGGQAVTTVRGTLMV